MSRQLIWLIIVLILGAYGYATYASDAVWGRAQDSIKSLDARITHQLDRIEMKLDRLATRSDGSS